MGFIAEGSFSQGWTLTDGELLPSDLPLLGLEVDAPPAGQKRGPWGPRFPRHDLPPAETAEIDRQAQRITGALTVADALAGAGEELGLSPDQIAAILASLTPVPEARISVRCSEGHHFAPDYPDGCCTGLKLTDDYEWVRCECECHAGQEVRLP